MSAVYIVQDVTWNEVVGVFSSRKNADAYVTEQVEKQIEKQESLLVLYFETDKPKETENDSQAPRL